MVKNLPAMQEFNPWVRKIPQRRERLLTPVFLPGESCGQRSLAGYSPWGHKESDMTERLTFSLSRKVSAIANDPPGSEEESWRIFQAL